MPQSSIIMVAPNGARKTKQHHPALPVNIAETVEEAARCYAAGASVIHAHVRGDSDEHVLDAGRYIELLQELKVQVPNMLAQVTTEAVGVYQPAEQVECVKAVNPEMISLALREMAGEGCDLKFARQFYEWAVENQVHVQHIVYDELDLIRLLMLRDQSVIPAGRLCILFVLGRFLENRQATPDDITPFLKQVKNEELDWFVCAFGSHEQACAISAIEQGGHARIGFENNLLLADGSTAANTAELVTALKQQMLALDHVPANGQEAREILCICKKSV
ncbi:MAG: 3-keto-5-aminohexanoate cleavage protein [Acidiferrobacterales bacterium]|nr:3-keto-5-aminohexanoate cleavage protein [Acidiferrobacterales bacterium]